MEKERDVFRSAQLLLKHMPDPIVVINGTLDIGWVNDAFIKIFGYEAEELLVQEGDGYGERTADVIQELAVSWLGESVQETRGIIRTIRKKDGSRIDVTCSLVPFQHEQGESAVFAIVLQGCVQRHADDVSALQPYEKYRIVAENTSDAIVLVDNSAVVRFVSPSIEPLSGFTASMYEGMDAFEIIHPDDRDRVRSLHAEAIRTRQPVDLEYRLIHALGHTVYIEARVKPFLDEEGQTKYVVAVARDVSERKQAEQLLENILANVNAAVISTDKDFSRLTFCSDSIEQILGISKKAAMESPIVMHSHMHPEDDAFLMYEAKERLDRGNPVDYTIRLTHLGEEPRWAQLFMHPYLDSRGAIERMDGILFDITETKRTQLALEESELRYRSLFDNNLDGVCSITLSGFSFVSANRSFERITGIRADLLTDRCFMGLIYDEDHQDVYEVLHHVMQKRESRHVECRIRQGEQIVSITFVPIFLSGELNGIHGIVQDITERKREERELVQSEERYKSLQQSLNRFSNDLANVMKVSELETRLIDEVKSVLSVTSVSIEEVPKGLETSLGEAAEKDIWVKLGEKKQPVYLRISMDEAMLRLEEEWLETAIHYVTILYDNLQLIEDLMKRLEDMVTKNETPKWMLRLLFKLSEKERASLSGDLHDSVLQDLIIWYRKLESLRSTAELDQQTRTYLHQIEEGLLDTIHQIRITCNELRPPFLLKMGLAESLKSLFAYARMFSNYEIQFAAEPLACLLNEDQILGVYRIVQELLNNASKHSRATKVTMTLSGTADVVSFVYSDDGVGMDLSTYESSFQHMGLAGMEKRVLSLEGKVAFASSPGQGFQAVIQVPTNSHRTGERYGHFIG